MFYSDSSTPRPIGAAAVLLPQTNPSIDPDSVANLRVDYSHTLYYEQVLDPFGTTGSYQSLIDYQFEVPSLILDHSSLVYIVSQTGNIIVFGFTDSPAYTQALSWPQTGFAMIVSAECVSTESHEAYMLNGFIYDKNKLTVAVNYTQAPVSNITSSFNVTIGLPRGVGDPKPYPHDVPYVDASFLKNSPAYLHDAYYANLDGSDDSALDAKLGGYYDSLSQALLYDLADPEAFNDDEAYNTLIEEPTSQEVADLEVTAIDEIHPDTITNAPNISMTNEEFDSGDLALLETATNNTNARIFSPSLNIRRLRRSYNLKENSEARASGKRRRRGFLSNLWKTAVNAFKDGVGLVKKAASTVQEVAKALKVAVFGGDYEKSERVNFAIGPSTDQVLFAYQLLKLKCHNCKVRGTLDIYGKFSFVKHGVSVSMSQGFIEVKGNMQVDAILKVTITGEKKFEQKLRLVAVPLSPIVVPGVFTLGPQAVLEIGTALTLTANFECTFGASYIWNNVYAKIDMKDSSRSQSSGWSPDRRVPVFEVSSRVGAELAAFLEAKIELGVDVFNGALKAVAGFAVKAGVVVTTDLQLSTDRPQCAPGVSVKLHAVIDLIAYAEIGIIHVSSLNTEVSIFKTSIELIAATCIKLDRKKRLIIHDDRVRRSLSSIRSEAGLDFYKHHHTQNGTQTKALVGTDEQTNRQKRQATQSSSASQSTSTVTTPGTFPTPSVVDVNDIFVPKVLGSFQLALQSDLSIIAVIGHDYNLYLSNGTLTNVSPTTFNLVDIMSANDSSFLIQDAKDNRYLHTYSQVQDDAYGRLRTHPENYMPHHSNMMFWTYSEGYLQFNRGQTWIYDTAACLSSTTGSVKVWVIDGEDGLTALQTRYHKCALAPLAFINTNP